MFPSKKLLRHTLLITLSLFGLALLWALARPVFAATIVVNTPTDEFGTGASCSLREAIQAANINAAFGGCAAGTAGADLINLPTGIYTLTRTGSNDNLNALGDLDVVTDTAGVLLMGTGPTSATVVIVGSGDRVLHAPSAPLTLSNLTLRGGSGVSDGGGAYFGGAATLTNTTFSGNTAWSYGGGADFSGLTNITGATFSGNTAGSDGGGASFGGITTLTSTTFSGNTANRDGGGANFLGVTIVTGTAFISNTASDGGGGAWFFNAAYVTETTFISNTANTGAGGGAWFINVKVTGATFSGNTASDGGGGAYFTSNATVTGTTFSANTAGGGGGAYFISTAQVTGTTFINNTATCGGGAYFTGSTAKGLVNVLFARNQASASGAAICVANANPLHLLHTTIVSPTAPTTAPQAIYVLLGTVQLTNTLIATHTVGIGNGGGSVREWHGLHSAVTTPYTGIVTATGSLTGTAAFYDTAQYRLTANSLAVDAGINANLSYDFFGNLRPQGRAPDVGYAESPFAPALSFVLTAQPAHLIANGLDEAVLTVTATLTNGVPLSGQPVTLTTPLGTLASPVVALAANGVTTTTYTVGVIPGITALTATLNDLGSLKVATTVVTLKPNPLIGSLSAQFGGQTITYTFALTNVVTTTQTVVMSGSVPLGANLVSVVGGTSVPTGGDYGAGYVEASNLVLAPNASYTLRWTVQFLGFTGDVVTQGHAESTQARLRVPVVLLIYRQLMMPVYGVP